MFFHSFAISVGIYRSVFSIPEPMTGKIYDPFVMYTYCPGGTKNKRVGTRHDFSMAWLEAEGNLSEGGLARSGSGFKKGSVLSSLLL
jgi:hypothetical protein